MREIRTGDRAHSSYVELEFLGLHAGGRIRLMTAELLDAVNSRGQPDIDVEDGRQLETSARSFVGNLSRGAAAAV